MTIKKIFLISLLMISFLPMGTHLAASEVDSVTEEMSEDSKKDFLTNMGISVTTEESSPDVIVCFDVNEAGLIAIGHENSERKTVDIYNSDGSFQYGYRFHYNAEFRIKWTENNLILYFVRSSVLVELDPNGNAIHVLKTKDSVEAFENQDNLTFSHTKKVGDVKYVMRKNIGPLNLFTLSYSQVVKVTSDGCETVIYDASSVHLARVVWIVLLGTVFIACVAVYLVHLLKTKRTKAET